MGKGYCIEKSNHHHSQSKIYLCPNWPGYWEQVHGLRQPFSNWVDFSCYKKRPANGIPSSVFFVTGFYRFDMMNMNNLREESAPKAVGDNIDAQHQFVALVQKLRTGEIDYFIITVGSRRTDGGAYIIGKILKNRTLLDYPVVLKPQDRHVSIFVREEKPLMPDVLCEWMEKLSPVLFGFSAHYLIPRNQRWSKSRVQKFFNCTDLG